MPCMIYIYIYTHLVSHWKVVQKFSPEIGWESNSCCPDLVLKNRLKDMFPLCGGCCCSGSSRYKMKRMHLRWRKFPKVWTSHNTAEQWQLSGMEINKTCQLRSSAQFSRHGKLINLHLMQYFSNMTNCIFPDERVYFSPFDFLPSHREEHQLEIDK